LPLLDDLITGGRTFSASQQYSDHTAVSTPPALNERAPSTICAGDSSAFEERLIGYASIPAAQSSGARGFARRQNRVPASSAKTLSSRRRR
jgi:hypothetical protein